jgi:hypothetical protein
MLKPFPYVYRANNYVAESNWGEDTTLTGSLDDLRIYDRVLSTAEVLELSQMGM